MHLDWPDRQTRLVGLFHAPALLFWKPVWTLNIV